MKPLTIKEFKLGRYVIHSMLLAIAGLSIGFGSALARPYAEFDGTHVEAVIEFFVLTPALCLLIVLSFLRIRYKQAIVAIIGQLTLLWLASFAGRIIVSTFRDPLMDDFFGMYFVFWLGSIIAAALLLGAVRYVWPLRYASSDCPACGYSLKGIGLSGACPECGRAFSAASLGVSEDALRAEE